MVPLLAGCLVAVLIPLVCKLARWAGFVDVPQGRKNHDIPVPPIGGFVIFSVFLAVMAIYGALPPAVIAALGLILVVGLIDDAHEVPAKIKFAVHFTAAFLVVIAGKAQLHSLGDLLGFGDMSLGVFAIPFSVACVVYIQNAINMMDGVDGLAGGMSLIIFAGLWGAAFLEQNTQEAFQLSVLMACVGGFLIYNMRSPFLCRARIFLGDAGSMALGVMIAWYAITLSQGQHSAIHPVSVAWMLALPIMDSFGLLAARLKEGRPPFAPDRRHFHHHFAAAGFSPAATTILILIYAACLAAIGYGGVAIGIPDFVLGWAWIALWIGHTLLTMKSEAFIRFLTACRAKIRHQ